MPTKKDTVSHNKKTNKSQQNTKSTQNQRQNQRQHSKPKQKPKTQALSVMPMGFYMQSYLFSSHNGKTEENNISVRSQDNKIHGMYLHKKNNRTVDKKEIKSIKDFNKIRTTILV